MQMSKNKSVVGIVDDEARAESLVESLQTAGFSGNDISVLLPDKRGTQDFAHEHSTKAPEGAVVGVVGGGVVGGTIGLLAGVGALAIPGLGPFIAAGPLMAALSGAAAAAAVGGVTGALIGMGIPELEAKKYEGKLRGGNVLLAVHVEERDEQKRAESVMKMGGARDISVAGESSVPKADSHPTR